MCLESSDGKLLGLKERADLFIGMKMVFFYRSFLVFMKSLRGANM
jgi:hypothetical protein